jgi:sugar/nucleoside kinase (ribokinase family)
MSILVVGSVAFDSLETPSGKRERVLGGAAVHFALAASFFTKVRVVGVVGEDFLSEHERVLTERAIDIAGIERAEGKSFHWRGEYMRDLNEADTLATDLNVFGSFEPKIPQSYLDSDYLFLANIDPVLQLRVRSMLPNVKLVGGDTMNYWINMHRENLLPVLKELDILIINDKETKLLTGEENGLKAAEGTLALGPKSLVVKYGEHGSAAFFTPELFRTRDVQKMFRAPATPQAEVVDPTGAGDSFAGGFFGYLASQEELTQEVFRRAMFYGCVCGSLCVEEFGTERLQRTTREEIEVRFEQLREMTHLS